MRLDKWLWYARFFKTRSLAKRICIEGGIRINGSRTDKAHTAVRVGQILTFRQGRKIRVVRVLGLGVRRGPAYEAASLYLDLSDKELLPSLHLVKVKSH